MIKMTKNRINDLEIENVYLKSELLDRPTMRDQFAMAALTGMLAGYSNDEEGQHFVEVAYQFADYMMKERDEPTKN
jgi:hypothetical protein